MVKNRQILAVMAALGLSLFGVATQAQVVSPNVRCESNRSVYYINETTRTRHFYLMGQTYQTWYFTSTFAPDWSLVRVVPTANCAAFFANYRLGEPVPFRPAGRFLVKFQYHPEIYLVVGPHELRHVTDAAILRTWYPSPNPRVSVDLGWERRIIEIPDQYGTHYRILPEVIDDVNDVNLAQISSLYSTPADVLNRMVANPNPNPNPNPAPAPAPVTPPPTPTPPAPAPVTPPPPAPAPTTPAPAPVTPAPAPQPTGGQNQVGITDPYRVIPRTTLARPALGANVTDSVYGSILRRITDPSSNTFERHEYSQLQAFNRDSSLILLNRNGQFVVRDVNSLQIVRQLPNDINAPRWNPANADEVIFFDSNDVGSGNRTVVIERLNVRTGVRSAIATLPARYERVQGSISWEEISQDGRWIAALLNRVGGGTTFVSYNLAEGRMGATIDMESLTGGGCGMAQNGPNWVAPSPLGRYLVIQWNRDGNSLCEGVEVRNIETGAYVGHVGENRQHSDIAIDANGNEVYVAPYFISSLLLTATQFPGSVNFARGYDKVILDTGWFHMDHISCKGPAGYCVVTAGGDNSSPFGGEVYLVYLEGTAADNGVNNNARVRRLTQHRSSSCDYRAQPQASIARNGAYVVFGSDWGQCNSGSAAYLVDLRNANLSLPAATQPANNTNTNNTNNQTNNNANTNNNNTNTNQTTNNTNTNTNNTQTNNQTNQSTGTQPALGSTGALPQSTYTNGADSANLRVADPTWFAPVRGESFVKFAFDHGIGGNGCGDTNFINYSIYSAPTGSSVFTLLGRHTGSAVGNFVSGSSMETTGCAKGVFIYNLSVPRGANQFAVCVENANNSTERHCARVEESTL